MNLLNLSNIVRFPQPDIANSAERPPVTQETAAPKPIEPEKPLIIEAMPWEPLPDGYRDHRPHLQRDGLFLWFWARYNDTMIRIVWMKSCGNMHKYHTWAHEGDDLSTVFPIVKYNGEHGGRGQDPDYIVYAAPRDLTLSARDAFVAKLRESGISTDFDYKFTLGKQRAAREAALLDRIENHPMESSLNSDEEEFLKVYRKLENEGKVEIIEYLKNLLSEQVQKETAAMEAEPPGPIDQILDPFKGEYSIQDLLNSIIEEFFDNGEIRRKPEQNRKARVKQTKAFIPSQGASGRL